MSFFRKLLYYLLGVGLGLLMVYFFFGDRDIQCSYFPNDRVLSDLRKKDRQYSPLALRKMENWQLDSNLLDRMLLSGDVDFTKSNTHGKDTCKTYWIDLTKNNERPLSGEWMNCDSTVYLLDLYPMNPDQ